MCGGAGARGKITVRADSGFWSYALLAALDQLGVDWSITCQLNNKAKALITDIGEETWTSIAYPRGGQAQVAETVMSMTNPRRRSERRRGPVCWCAVPASSVTKPHYGPTGGTTRSSPTWTCRRAEADQYHHPRAGEDSEPSPTVDGHRPCWGEEDTETSAAATAHSAGKKNNEPSAAEADRYHRRHATCELAIRDLKGSGGLAHLPSGYFPANAAWLLCAALAHNLYRWLALLGGTHQPGRLICGRTIRTQLFGVPGRLVNHGRRHIVRLPARWPLGRRLPHHPR